MTWSLVSLGAVLLIDILVSKRIQNHFRLRHIPGPFWTGWTDLWLIRRQLGGELNFELYDVNKKYGPLARIGPNWVVCSDPNELRRIWSVHSDYKRAYWYRGLRVDPYRDSTFSTLDECVHDDLRTKLLPGYGGKDVDNLHDINDEQVLGLVRLLESKYLSVDGRRDETIIEKGGTEKSRYVTVDLARKIQFFTLDVISSLAFGRSFDYLKADADTFGYIHTTESTMPILMTTALVPGLVDLMQTQWLRRIMPDIRKMVGIGTVMNLAHDAVSERYASPPVVKRDMLGSFISHGLSQADAEGEAVVQIIAGSDTSATAIRSTFLFLISSPHAYTRLQREIDAGVIAGRISSPIIDAEARAFPYLQAVIREGLRMWPPATGLLPKVSDHDDIICGHHIPSGTCVAWAVWSVMRDRSIFGEDAEIFCPERWLNISPEKYRLMDQTLMLDFAGGSRYECLGKNVALIELNKVYVEVGHSFFLSIAYEAMLFPA
ncbi:benzoate 4-monooxygenase cytochrome p450 [Grosmannia clavigera kw1407]|uniref:Benzoate 4-monooxygenase cytochrome p450 n=1 Tax=Grosmannia clavigera (strain kw1407 / UAMH 11150) TaxID=655863 RepID=F0XNR7_GROCL|nr:benzoate 4-monooxygenase cytochrome p450 [Grosmannia clavigera kw1407]EFX00479.1 benzoate 4-monooxygenase cytochrome p450 [Grosmannia clavigera kw1407]